MIIQVFQSGGLAGGEPTLVGRLDASALAGEEKARVKKLVDVLEHPPDDSAPIGADMLEYTIELREGDGPRRTIVVPDDMNPNNPSLRAVQELQAIASRSA
jgi:hypothetical protein